MSNVLNNYIDSLVANGKRSVIDERNTAVTGLTDKWNQNVSNLVAKRNAEIETLRKAMPTSQTSFTTGAGMTAGGYGLGRLAALCKRIGKMHGNGAGLIVAGLTAGGIMLKDKLMPGKAKLPSVVPSKWVDPSNPSPKMPDPTIWQRIQSLVGARQPETRKWVTDKKYAPTIGGGTPKPEPQQQPAEQAASKAPEKPATKPTTKETEKAPEKKTSAYIAARTGLDRLIQSG